MEIMREAYIFENEVNTMKLIKIKRQYTNAEGVKKNATDFYLIVEGVSKPIAIAPKKYGDKGDTFKALDLVAEYVKSNKE